MTHLVTLSAQQLVYEALHQSVLAYQTSIGRVVFATDCMILTQAMVNGEMELAPLRISF
jgi:hypothetical protein